MVKPCQSSIAALKRSSSEVVPNWYTPTFNQYSILYVWAYERSTQEYLAIKQDPLTIIIQTLADNVNDTDRNNVQALIIQELSRLHEGALARYGLRPSEFYHWQTHQIPKL